PRGWFLAAVVGLTPAFVAGGSTPVLALAVGGIVLAYRALQNLGEGLDQLTAAVIAGERIGLFWRAARRGDPAGHPRFTMALAVEPPSPVGRLSRAVRTALESRPTDERPPLLDACDLVFRHRERGEAVLQGAALRIHAGDRVLLEGPSGGGKSTLAAVLAGGRVPEAGVRLLGGLDLATLGAEAWRRRVRLAPQVPLNHHFVWGVAFHIL